MLACGGLGIDRAAGRIGVEPCESVKDPSYDKKAI